MYVITERISKITKLVAWLQTLTGTAETFFWNALSSEFTMTGTLTDDPFDAATKSVAAATETLDAILVELNTICDQSGTLTIDPAKTLNSTNALALSRGIGYVTTALNNLLRAPIDDGVQMAMQPALADIYTHAKTLLESVGVLFPAVFTSFYPVADGLQITAIGGAGTLTLTLGDGTDPVNWPAGAGWEQLAAGDLIKIVTLNATNEGPVSVVGNSYFVDSVSSENLVLTVPDMTTADFDGVGDGVDTGIATVPGAEFILRKIEGA